MEKTCKSVDTIVIMMGLSRLGIICKELIAGGLEKTNPCSSNSGRNNSKT